MTTPFPLSGLSYTKQHVALSCMSLLRHPAVSNIGYMEYESIIVGWRQVRLHGYGGYWSGRPEWTWYPLACVKSSYRSST